MAMSCSAAIETSRALSFEVGKPPLLANKARPARATMEVASLAVPGWPVEVEVTATYKKR
jgi:enamine deaminase RidA (YjgF/YER057c/UK114 family)